MTDGERLHGEASQDIAAQRREEAMRAAGLLGCSRTLFLGLPDGGVRGQIEKGYDGLSRLFQKNRPDIIFSPSPVDHHADHIAVSEMALKLFNAGYSARLAFYEVYSTIRFNYLIDITDVIGEKKKAILNYHTSLYGKPGVYADAAIGLNTHRSLFVQRSGFFEALYILEEAADMEVIRDYFSYKDIM